MKALMTISSASSGTPLTIFLFQATITTPYPTVKKPRFRRKAGTRLLTHILTQTAKILYGNSGEDDAKRYLEPERKGQNSAQKGQMDTRTVAHNPEVAGSSPVSATIKTADFERNRRFFVTFSAFSVIVHFFYAHFYHKQNSTLFFCQIRARKSGGYPLILLEIQHFPCIFQ